jgi:hypothetical protein
MSFPTNPIAGQKTTRNGIVYAYSTATNSWRRDFNNVLDQLTIAGIYSSTDTNTGALIVYGGVGIGENLNVAGQLNVGGEVNLSPNGADVNILPSVGGTVLIYPGQYGYIDNMIIGGTQPRIGYFTDIIIEGTSNSVSTNTGALTVEGGAGIGRDLWVGGIIYQNGLPIAGSTTYNWITTNTNYTAVSNDHIFVDTSSGTVTVTLPASPSVGDNVSFVDYAGTCGTNPLVFDRNGNLIMGLAEDLVVDVFNAANMLIYSGSTQGWKIGAVL